MKQDRDTKIGERAKAIVKAKASMEALRKAQAAPKRPMPKEPTTGGSDTVPMTSDRADFLKEMAKRNAAPGMKKGGKAKANPFGATKFGSAMMKKSADTKGRAMVKKAGGGKCYASGGKVKKMAVGGMPMTTAMGGAAPTTPPMQSSPMPSGTPQTPPATGNNTGMDPAKAIAQMQAQKKPAPPQMRSMSDVAAQVGKYKSDFAAAEAKQLGGSSGSGALNIMQPRVSRPRDPAPAPTPTPPQTANPTKVTPLEALQSKYSSATPNRDASAKINTTTGVSTPANFDRNQSSRDFNTVGRNFMNQGVPKQAIIQAQGELRKLQMDNSSTPAQHQAAMQQILARMNSLVPKKSSPQVDKRFAKGGSTKAATKSGRALVKKSADTEGRAMKKFASGGLASGHKAANGVAKKGLTKGKQVGACYAKGGSVRSIDGIATKGKTRCKGARK
jgi:hypothetical protein